MSRTCDFCNKSLSIKKPVILYEKRHDGRGIVTAAFHENCAWAASFEWKISGDQAERVGYGISGISGV
jgi:hypothetical protein